MCHRKLFPWFQPGSGSVIHVAELDPERAFEAERRTWTSERGAELANVVQAAPYAGYCLCEVTKHLMTWLRAMSTYCGANRSLEAQMLMSRRSFSALERRRPELDLRSSHGPRIAFLAQPFCISAVKCFRVAPEAATWRSSVGGLAVSFQARPCTLLAQSRKGTGPRPLACQPHSHAILSTRQLVGLCGKRR